MFIERSAGRIRLMRTLFVLLGLVPCAGLCGWAALRHSVAHRRAVERLCEQAVGLPLAIGAVDHVRPNVMRLHECVLCGESGAVVIRVPVIEVESLATELRVNLARLDCTPELARVLARIAREWLRQPARFPVDCVVDVEDFSWRHRRAPAGGAAPTADHPSQREWARSFHVECVAANGSRAIRVRSAGERGGVADEVRVVSGALVGAGDDGTHSLSGDLVPGNEPSPASAASSALLRVTGTVSEPVPIAVFEALAGLEAGALPLGDEAVVSGNIDAVLATGRQSGSAAGHVERIDLAAASRYLPHRASGEAALAVDEIAWKNGRITTCACRFSVSRGRIGQRLLDACVSALGCRPGPAYRSLAREEVRSFDDVSAAIRIDATGVDLRSGPDRSGVLVRSQGLSIIDEPRSPVPVDRLAWLLAPPGAVAVPASTVTGWLLGFFTLDGPMGAGTQGNAATIAPTPAPVQEGVRSQAVRPIRRNEF